MPRQPIEFEHRLFDDSEPKERARRAQELEQNLFNGFVFDGMARLDVYSDECQRQFQPLLAYGHIYPDLSAFKLGFVKDDKHDDRRRVEYLKHISSQWDIFETVHNIAQLSYRNIGLIDLPDKPPVIITAFIDLGGSYRPEARIQFDYENLVDHYTTGVINKGRPRYEIMRAARELFIGYASSTGEMLDDYYRNHPNFFKQR